MDAINRLNAPPAAGAALRATTRAILGTALQFRSPEQIAAAQTRGCAASHEAGHCVVLAAEGIPIRDVRVSSKGGFWTGLTMERAPWTLTPEMGPEPYLQRARVAVAGWCGELAADLDVIGSSSDELAVSQSLAAQAAMVADASLEELWFGHVIGPTINMLSTNRAAHRRIASALMNTKRLHGARLAALLRGIKERSP